MPYFKNISHLNNYLSTLDKQYISHKFISTYFVDFLENSENRKVMRISKKKI